MIEGVWPPAPLRDEPPPLFLRVEGMQLTRSGDRLVFLNMSIRRFFLAESCLLSCSLLLPWISFWTSPLYHATLPSLLFYLTSNHLLPWESLFILFVCALIWCLFTFFGNLRGATFDTAEQSVKAGGRRARPMSKIEAIQIKPMPNTFLGRRYVVSLLWSSDDPTPRWQKALTNTLGNKCFLGAFRQEANAEKVAAMVAEFAVVLVQQTASEKPVSL